MSIFGKIKDAIFGHKDKTAAQTGGTTTGGFGSSTTPPASAQPQPAPTETIDVEQVLSAKAEQSGQDLNWRSSIVDLMKLVGIDSSLDNRKSLAKELGYDGTPDGSAEMNIWLHKATMAELAKHGGHVPAAMLD